MYLGPIFHEGLKGWACCKKRVVSFDDFLAIPGCTVGRHRHEPGVPKPTAGSMGVDKGPAKETPKVVSETDGGAVYTLSEALSGLDPGSGTGTTASPPELPPPTQTETGPKEEELNDPADATIPVGTKCRRRGCGCEYAGPESREDECTVRC